MTETVGSVFTPLAHLPDDLVLEFASTVPLSPEISHQLAVFFSIIHFPPPGTILPLCFSTSLEMYQSLQFPLSHFPFFSSRQAFKFTITTFINAINDQILPNPKGDFHSTCASPPNPIWHSFTLLWPTSSFRPLNLIGFVFFLLHQLILLEVSFPKFEVPQGATLVSPAYYKTFKYHPYPLFPTQTLYIRLPSRYLLVDSY